MKSFIKKFIPASWLLFYHKLLAGLAALWYRHPSDELVVIAVTGTNGKTTVVNMISAILEGAGYKMGLVSTVNFKIEKREWLNNLKMTMPGRFALQKMLRKMVDAGCQYAVVETSSEGIRQFRHLGINYDVGVFTNLTAEHLESHGGFENYKKEKLKLFAHIAKSKKKNNGISKTLIANADDRHAEDFLKFNVEKKVKFGIEKASDYQAKDIKLQENGASFAIDDSKFFIQLPGRFNVYNALAAIAATHTLGLDIKKIQKTLKMFTGVPGRMEVVDEGQDFTIVVDYAPEPVGLHETYQALEVFDKKRIIHILGSTGGGRDQSRRPILGYIAGQNADIVIVTNEDPYDEDPKRIIEDVGHGAGAAGKHEGQNLHKILDRREAIRFALSEARPGDLVLITGKGAEQAMVVAGGKKVPWDDRVVVREELQQITNSKSKSSNKFQ